MVRFMQRREEARRLPTSLSSIIGEEAVRWLQSSQTPARGLPGCAYTSDALTVLEFERLYTPTWVHVGHVHELAEPGDACPVSLFGRPLLLLRDPEGGVRAFHNVCRHRGTRLLDKACSGLRSLVCRYHGWSYHLDGRLKSAPHFGGYQELCSPGFDAAEFGLRSIRCEVFGDWVFINLSGVAPALEEYLQPLLAQVPQVNFAKLTHFLSLDFGAVPANWKLVLENSLENYHLPIVHARTAAKQPLKDHFFDHRRTVYRLGH